VQGDGHFLHNDHAAFEEGTVNYLDIPAVKFGLEYIKILGIDTINKRVEILTNWLLNKFRILRHGNGMPLLHVYGPQGVDNRGGTICLNFYDKDGGLWDFREIEKEAGNWNISLRTGCFCNPGIDETNHNIDPKALCEYFNSDLPKDYFDLVEYLGHPRGAVRISLGYISGFRDVYRFIMFCEGFLDR
jgi:selenocysteine lyase/cysteine desulfurase